MWENAYISEVNGARKLILGLQVNIDNNIIWTKPTVADMTLSGILYMGGPAKIRNQHISVLYILCEVKFKFKCLHLTSVNFMPNGTASGSVDIYG